MSPVDFLALAILHQVDDKTADCIFWCLGQVDRVCYFLHRRDSIGHVSEHLRVERNYVSFQCQFGSGSVFLYWGLVWGHGSFYHANDFDATKLLHFDELIRQQGHRDGRVTLVAVAEAGAGAKAQVR